MKIIIFIIIIAFAFFLFALNRSGALTKSQEWVIRGGVRVYEPVNRVDWDKFYEYVVRIPKSIFGKVQGIIPERKPKKDKLKIERAESGKVSVTK